MILSNYYGAVNYNSNAQSIYGISSTNDIAPYRLGEIGISQSDVTPPAVPSFTYISNTASNIFMAWSDESVSGAVAYNLYRSININTWTNFNTYYTNITGGAVTSWTDNVVGLGTNYYYFVTALDDPGTAYTNESWFSSSVGTNLPLPVYAASNTNTEAVYVTIQDALNAANPHETIVVFDGEYNESLIISNHAVNLLAWSWITNNNNRAVIIDSAPGTTNIFINATK